MLQNIGVCANCMRSFSEKDELEKHIIELKKQFADEKEQLMEGQRKIVADFERQIEELKNSHNQVTRQIREDHEAAMR